ncbi:pentatricopeptide repeat-containing protein At4g02750-like [Aristolochia californica]|uniref:pentatricopeptide repeat-containing protein At4g02750-like n=1 Tax=Aristolochia californica TaxID=171875 RepID=UPI0035E0B895
MRLHGMFQILFRSVDGCSSRQPLYLPKRTISTQDVFAYNVKIGELGRAGKIEAVRHLFDTMPNRDVVSWNAIIAAYWQNGNLEESKRIFNSMPVRNIVSWNSMIAGCVEHDQIEEACEYFFRMPERNVASWNVMISGFLKYERIEEASRLFSEMPIKNVISYTAMVEGYARKGEIERARSIFDKMPKKNEVSWVVMISGYVENGMFEEARRMFYQMPRKNTVAMTAMVTAYAKEGKMDFARSLFEEIQFKDRISWNAMIGGYTHNGHGDEALKLHKKMLEADVRPDHTTFVLGLTASSNVVSLQQGRQIHVFIIKSGFQSEISVCNTLITMYSKCGSIDDSELVFREMGNPDVVSWNTIIAGLGQHGHYVRALGFFEEMKMSELQPDGITFLNVFSACGHVGRVERSLDLLESMVNNYGVEPQAQHYSCLVDILSRAGKLDQAYKLIIKMPFEPDGAVWGALLGACRVHLNLELGELAAAKIFELEPQNSAAYVMLSNIYAAMGMWKEVTRIRWLMKENGVKKQPGYSWMEINNKVQLFLGGDISHPEIEKIRLELKRICLQMNMTDEDEGMKFL